MARTEQSANSELEDFLEGFERALEQLGDLGKRAAGERDEALVAVEVLTGPLTAQYRKMRFVVEEEASQASQEQRMQANRMVASTAAREMFTAVDIGVDSAAKLGFLSGDVLDGLFSIVTELKKVVEEIFPALGTEPPKWWVAVDLILDQLVKGLLTKILDLFGGDGERLAQRLSISEQTSLAERAAMRKGRSGN